MPGTARRPAAEQIHRMNRELAALEGHAESSSGLVAAVVGVRHDLRSLRIDPRVYREPDTNALAEDVVEAIREACHDVDRQAGELTGPLLPDGDDPFLRALDELAGTRGSR
ncbi:YbaB/EbfC family nucleoid-associated protein [Allorhizocola rhizosphaerae]|uniref:YbaB/EbfC family nucleoid-associated protein n=1 Tax=Allorhizocola rhizosphaerae TaxID=1872709 RepID=UPI000E3E525F|nr:YbaB/EbfC family nucleoid-associated protein [Allorhizocola rhizosphaerae]